jgi:hypothetical protein
VDVPGAFEAYELLFLLASCGPQMDKLVHVLVQGHVALMEDYRWSRQVFFSYMILWPSWFEAFTKAHAFYPDMLHEQL